ncbi:hypothetical protein FACS189419_09600 [Planctomycetales bacterium]|nr:hypothetical protein FACS189419_09600 [Planctomycetales bacterium]
MSKPVDQPECIHSQPASTRSLWKFGTTGWVLIGGLLLLNIGVVVETVGWNKLTVGWLLYRLDPRYWVLYPIPFLWGIVCWLVTDITCRIGWIRRKQRWIRLVIILGTLCAAALLVGWTGKRIRTQIYYGLYLTYIVNPISHYMIAGIWDWKILIAPSMVIVTIAVLLYLAVKYRKPKL